MYKSPLTNSSNVDVLFEQIAVPIFQHIVYKTSQEAILGKKSKVILAQCKDTGFIFNAEFNIDTLVYDENYQNEQSNSSYFQGHLSKVLHLLDNRGLLKGKVLEIGCGKGYFMNMLLEKGINVIGIDPTYEGESDRIIKEYYSEKFSHINADLIVLRHTLEHLPKPLDFLKMIAKANNYFGKIYIEIPTFDWIVKNNTIEDIFYEHCNYFTPQTISLLFNKCEITYIFNKQYIGVIANLSDVKDVILPILNIEMHQLLFEKKLERYKAIINEYANLAIWGAGAKGSTFLNLMDPKQDKIKCVIDINPKKQNYFIGGTGHKIISPDQIDNSNIDNIIVMNSNYSNEIKSITNKNIIEL